jgi:DNA replicative helicase MCM subunit Mcm2 (Cdc46/Mcm family)
MEYSSLNDAHAKKACHPTNSDEVMEHIEKHFKRAQEEVPESYKSGLEPKKRSGNHGK